MARFPSELLRGTGGKFLNLIALFRTHSSFSSALRRQSESVQKRALPCQHLFELNLKKSNLRGIPRRRSRITTHYYSRELKELIPQNHYLQDDKLIYFSQKTFHSGHCTGEVILELSPSHTFPVLPIFCHSGTSQVRPQCKEQQFLAWNRKC